ncbi:MAG TPA: tetratricopeptide repeat protein [Candidatus Edwardsbacteria bacterium]|nr:tetratricopeptide repeat protein [Candidatus Edwardsbacteria bacterium]
MRQILPYLLLAAVIAAVYGRTLAFQPVGLDDDKLIARSEQLVKQPGGFAQLFRSDVFGQRSGPLFYRPLLGMSFYLDAQWGAPWIARLANLLIHLLAVWAAYYLMIALGARPRAAFLLAWLLAAHPALAQAVAWLPGRNDSLLALCLLLALIAIERRAAAGKAWWLAAGAAAFLLALLAKESALLFPPLALWFAWLRSPKESRKQDLIAWAVAVAIAVAIYFALRSLAGPAAMPFSASAQTAALGMLSYLGKALLPFRLALVPDVRDVQPARGIASIIALAAVLALARKRDARGVAFGMAWLLVFLLPGLSAGTFLEHRLYVPLIGLVLAAAWLDVAWSRWAFAGPMLFSALCFIRVGDFRDPGTAWPRAVLASPHSALAHNQYGLSLSRAGSVSAARREYQSAATLDPGLPHVWYNLGTACLRQADYPAAAAALERALQADPQQALARYNLGLADEGLKRYPDAERCYRDEIGRDPSCQPAYVSLGALQQERGQLKEAEQSYFKALQSGPDNADVHVNLGALYLAQRRYAEAEPQCRRAVELDPGNWRGWVNYGQYFLARGDRGRAGQCFERASSIDPQIRPLLATRGWIKDR